MDYQACIHALFSRNMTGGMKLGLENMKQLCSKLGNPETSFKTIHIAGTNGKGSVVTKLAASLQSEGYTVGLYTSPHISCYRERIRVNGIMISEYEVEEICSRVFDIVHRYEIPATFFEITTCIAFEYFAQKKVDFAVLETGLGGRLDATNVCHPLISVITSISLDHTKILGTTLETIAYEKGGIIKNNVPVVIGPRVPRDVICEIAEKCSSQVFIAKSAEEHFEEENKAIAKTTLQVLQTKIQLSDASIEQGIVALPPCRYEVVPEALVPRADSGALPVKVILDVAHNPDGIQKLFERISNCEKNKAITCVFGISLDKDVDECLSMLLQRVETVVFVQAASPRACPAEELRSRAQKIHTKAKIFTFDNIDEAMPFAFAQAQKKNNILLVCGTFFIMKECRRFLGYSEDCDPLDLNESNLHSNKVS